MVFYGNSLNKKNYKMILIYTKVKQLTNNIQVHSPIERTAEKEILECSTDLQRMLDAENDSIIIMED